MPVLILAFALVVPQIEAQSKGARLRKGISQPKSVTPQAKLQEAVTLSRDQKAIRVTTEVFVQGKNRSGVFEYVAPGRFYSKLFFPDGKIREAIEIDRQRYQKHEDQWVKVRKDPYPLREQFFEFYTPIKFISDRSDVIKIKSVKVDSLGAETRKGKSYLKYAYTISYKNYEPVEVGVAFVNTSNGLVEIIEAENCGLFGFAKALWTYEFNDPGRIESPANYVVRDWIN